MRPTHAIADIAARPTPTPIPIPAPVEIPLPPPVDADGDGVESPATGVAVALLKLVAGDVDSEVAGSEVADDDKAEVEELDTAS